MELSGDERILLGWITEKYYKGLGECSWHIIDEASDGLAIKFCMMCGVKIEASKWFFCIYSLLLGLRNHR